MPTTSSIDDYAGSVALITGASRPHGLGVAVARELATKGFHAVLAGRDLDQTRQRAESLNRIEGPSGADDEGSSFQQVRGSGGS